MTLPHASVPSAGERLLAISSVRLFRRQVSAVLGNPADCAMLWESLDAAGRQSLVNRIGKLRGGSELLSELHQQLARSSSLYRSRFSALGVFPADPAGRYSAWLADPAGFASRLAALPRQQATPIADDVHAEQAAALARALPRGLGFGEVSGDGAKSVGVAAAVIVGFAAGSVALGSALSAIAVGGVAVASGELLLTYLKFNVPAHLRPFALSRRALKLTALGSLEAGKLAARMVSRRIDRSRLSRRGIV